MNRSVACVTALYRDGGGDVPSASLILRWWGWRAWRDPRYKREAGPRGPRRAVVRFEHEGPPGRGFRLLRRVSAGRWRLSKGTQLAWCRP